MSDSSIIEVDSPIDGCNCDSLNKITFETVEMLGTWIAHQVQLTERLTVKYLINYVIPIQHMRHTVLSDSKIFRTKTLPRSKSDLCIIPDFGCITLDV